MDNKLYWASVQEPERVLDIGTGTGMTVVAYFNPAPRGANAGMVLVWGVVGALVVGLACGGVAMGVSERAIVERAKRLRRLVQADGGVKVRAGAMRMLDSSLDATEAALIEKAKGQVGRAERVHLREQPGERKGRRDEPHHGFRIEPIRMRERGLAVGHELHSLCPCEQGRGEGENHRA